ncbi:MAPEG family protein [Alteromonas antoniana]|uniref:MAPEG family protein n=1 Tax=Alteromonas antoniana TaxID=2803813 RepID=UPI001C44CCA3|nr:MAPEG family protein [Alteromonas antoniana]
MNSLLAPMFAHVIWCTALYVLLTAVRAPAVWGIGQRADGTNPYAHLQTKVSANLSNQFEWPLFFHLICVLLMIHHTTIPQVYPLLAWLFIAGRVGHSVVQIFSSNVRVRGLVFTINFAAVLAMWCLLVFATL